MPPPTKLCRLSQKTCASTGIQLSMTSISDYFVKVLATVLNLLTCPFVVLLNALVIIAVKTKPRLQSKHNILLACLAVTDHLLVGIGAQPVYIVHEISTLVSGSSSLSCSLDNIVQLTDSAFALCQFYTWRSSASNVSWPSNIPCDMRAS